MFRLSSSVAGEPASREHWRFLVSCWIFGQSLLDIGNPGKKKVRKTRKSELGPRLVYLDQEQCSPINNGVQVQAAGINHSVLLIFVRSRKKKIMRSKDCASSTKDLKPLKTSQVANLRVVWTSEPLNSSPRILWMFKQYEKNISMTKLRNELFRL